MRQTLIRKGGSIWPKIPASILAESHCNIIGIVVGSVVVELDVVDLVVVELAIIQLALVEVGHTEDERDGSIWPKITAPSLSPIS